MHCNMCTRTYLSHHCVLALKLAGTLYQSIYSSMVLNITSRIHIRHLSYRRLLFLSLCSVDVYQVVYIARKIILHFFLKRLYCKGLGVYNNIEDHEMIVPAQARCGQRLYVFQMWQRAGPQLQLIKGASIAEYYAFSAHWRRYQYSDLRPVRYGACMWEPCMI